MKLGERLDVVTFTIKGDTSKFGCIKLIDEIIKVLGMHKVHEPTCYKYPVNGNGGMGFSFIQPITESFIAFDSWTEFDGAYLILCSCKTINISKVKKKIRACGYRIKEHMAHELSLKERASENGFFQ